MPSWAVANAAPARATCTGAASTLKVAPAVDWPSTGGLTPGTRLAAPSDSSRPTTTSQDQPRVHGRMFTGLCINLRNWVGPMYPTRQSLDIRATTDTVAFGSGL